MHAQIYTTTTACIDAAKLASTNHNALPSFARPHLPSIRHDDDAVVVSVRCKEFMAAEIREVLLVFLGGRACVARARARSLALSDVFYGETFKSYTLRPRNTQRQRWRPVRRARTETLSTAVHTRDV